MHVIPDIAAVLLDFGQAAGDMPALLAGPFDDASNLMFFREVSSMLRDALDDYGAKLFERMMTWVGMAALTLMTLWVMIHGYRIVSGRSRDSMTAFATDMMRAVLIVGIATGSALGGSTLFKFVSNDLGNQINRLVADDDGDVYEKIDRNLGLMQMATSRIDAIQTGDDPQLQDENKRNKLLIGFGMAGPAIIAGIMLLYYKGMMALIIGFGPIAVLSLLFEQSKPVFQKWLNFALGTLFSLAVLNVFSALATDITAAVASSFWVGKLLGSSPEGVSSMSWQQGGIGLILTTLIITLPQGAASFFGGLLGSFNAYSSFGKGDSAGRTPGMPGYVPSINQGSMADRPEVSRRPDNHSRASSGQGDVIKKAPATRQE